MGAHIARRSAIAAAVVILAACHWGPRAETFPLARAPSGAGITIQTSRGTVSGELLAVEDSGLVVRQNGRVTFASFAAIGSGALDAFESEYRMAGGRRPPSDALARWRLVSHFPQGISREILARLLALNNQTSVELLR